MHADLSLRFDADEFDPHITYTRIDFNSTLVADTSLPEETQSFAFEAWVRILGNQGTWRTGE